MSYGWLNDWEKEREEFEDEILKDKQPIIKQEEQPYKLYESSGGQLSFFAEPDQESKKNNSQINDEEEDENIK